MKTFFKLYFLKTVFLLGIHQGGLAQTFTNELIDIVKGAGTFNVGCIVYKPAGYDATRKYPLVIFTHGLGEQGLNTSILYNTGLPQVLKSGYTPPFDFIMVAPQRSSYSVPPSWLPAIIEESIKKWDIDTDRIYLTGLSAGGWGCYGSQLNEDTTLAKKIAAIVIMSGATQDANKNNFDWFKISKTPIWSVVGNNDVSYRDQNIYMVNSINARVSGLATITIRAGVGHSGWNDVYNGTVKTADGKNMWEWLYSFNRGGKEPIPPTPVPSTPIKLFNYKVGDTLLIESINDSVITIRKPKQ